jgi:hypothetical protein
MPEAPKLTAEQRAQALADAAAARAVRADVRARLKAGVLTVPDLLAQAEQDPRLAAMRVSALIAALPGYGPARSAALMRRLRIAESRRIRGLGARQRVALLASLDESAEPGQ